MHKINYVVLLYESDNLGDDIQCYAVELLLRRAGIDNKNIIFLSEKPNTDFLNFIKNDTYYIVPLVGAGQSRIAFAQYIKKHNLEDRFRLVPLAIGHLRKQFASTETLKKFKEGLDCFEEPIGCRDTETAKMLKELGYKTYINGCITNTLPVRDQQKKYEDVFFIDVPKNFTEYVPQNLKKSIKELSQIIPITDSTEQYRLSVERINELRDSASLVVTTRYHIAVPCLAMGIPVIMIEGKNDFYSADMDDRLSELNPFLDYYHTDEWCKINWETKPKQFEPFKKNMFEYAVKRVEYVIETLKYEEITSTFFKASKDRFYGVFENNRFLCDGTVIDKHLSAFFENYEKRFSYYIYGLSDEYLKYHNCSILDYILREYPQSVFKGFVDKNKAGSSFKGYQVISPDEIIYDENTYVVVGAYTANQYVEELFEKNNYDKEHLFLFPKEFLHYVYLQCKGEMFKDM